MRTGTMIVMLSGSLIGVGASAAMSAPAKSHPGDGVRRSSLVQRAHTQRAPLLIDRWSNRGQEGAAVFPNEFRTIDGVGNNLANPLWGAAATDMMRMMGSAYPLGSGETPARIDGPSARAVSNAVCANPGDLPNPVGASDYLWQWGQFLDHDIDETPVGDEAFDIQVPAGDVWFDPDNTGEVTIALDRSAYHVDTDGHRQQINEITAFIDGSAVYGSDEVRAAALRANDGTGMLVMSPGGLLPYNTAGLPNAPTAHNPTLFLAGDIRANEQAGLAAMHTLFVREHNHWAQQIAAQFPDADGDEIYERARVIVGAEMQAITFNEFLPLLLGHDAMGPYQGYNPDKAPMIANEFATAAYRMGHTMLSPNLRRLAATDTTAASGDLPLRDAFFNPTHIETHGIDTILRGLSSQRAQSIDSFIVDDVRNFLFGPPGSKGFDLASLNIQRGRDHGLPDYNSLRDMMGLPKITSFDQISPDPAVNAGFASVYASVDEIDPWVGFLAEAPADGAMVGQTLRAIMADQFERLRSGDRFWYEAYLPGEMVDMINQQTLAVIIRRNTGIGEELPDDVFIASAPCPADIDNDGALTFFDVSAFLHGFMGQDPRVDFSGNDGEFNFFDVNEFLNHFNAGCP